MTRFRIHTMKTHPIAIFALLANLALVPPGVAGSGSAHPEGDPADHQADHQNPHSANAPEPGGEAHADPHHDQDHDHDDDSPSTTLPTAMARRHGVTTAAAGPGTVERHLQVYGRLELPPEQQAAVAARFTGLVKRVAVAVGQTVAKGEVLAIVESNDSLKDYPVRAPINGTVQSRHTSVGEITGTGPLFRLVNSERLWATLQVFPSQRLEVRPGLSVHVLHNGHRHDSTIASVAPAEGGEPYVLARVELDNPLGDMAPGEWVSGKIDAEILAAPLVIKQRALQQLDGATVVFVQQGDDYRARPVTLGRSDGNHAEVLAGLEPGEHYVVDNSYLIKADIEKAGAAHQH